MLNTNPIEWYDRITQAEKLRDSVVHMQASMIRQYHGPSYREGDEPDRRWPENHWHEWLKNIRPQVVYDNPAVSVSTRRGGIDPRVSQSMEGVIDWWCKSVSLWNTLDRVFVDSAFSYGVMMTYYEPYPGFEGRLADDEAIPFRPNSKRIAPHRWFCDDDCDNYSEARFAGHIWRTDKDSLLEDDRFDSKAVSELIEGAGYQDKWRMSQDDAHKTSDPSDDQVICYDIWVPELDLTDDDRANGAILTMGVTFKSSGDPNEPAWIREPRPFWGPRWGPYTLFGYNIVPNNPYPLSPFVAVYEQIENLNEHATALARSAARHKKLVAVDSAHSDAAQIIQDAEDGDVITINQLSEAARELTLGGADQSQYQHVQWLREIRDRASGLTETSRGNVDDDATATAVSEAASQEQVRIAMLKRLFTSSTQNVLNTAGWYYFTEPNSVASLPKHMADQFAPRPSLMPDEAQGEMIALRTGFQRDRVDRALRWQPEVIFAGGPADELMSRVASRDGEPRFVISPNVPGVDYEDLMLEIEPYSMERTNEALLQKQRMELVDRVAAIAPLMAKAPQLLRYDELFDLLGEALNERNLSERLIPESVLEQIKAGDNPQQAQVQQILSQLQAQQGAAQQPASMAPQAASTSQPQAPISDMQMMATELAETYGVA